MGRSKMVLAGVVTAIVAMPAAAARPAAQSATLEALKTCRGQTDSAARLACYDAAVGKLLDAQAKNDVVVVDREQIRAAQRSLFGLSLPDFKLFGDADKGPKGEDIDRLETTLVSSQQDGYGKYIFVLAEGGRWHQIDDYEIPRKLHPGDKVVITRAALGSFKLAVGANSAVRVHREN